MDKGRITEALKVIQEEINSEELDTDMAIYQIYCAANCFIADEIKRIIKEEGSVTKEHPDIAPLYRLHESIMIPMRLYSETVRRSEENAKENISRKS